MGSCNCRHEHNKPLTINSREHTLGPVNAPSAAAASQSPLPHLLDLFAIQRGPRMPKECVVQKNMESYSRFLSNRCREEPYRLQLPEFKQKKSQYSTSLTYSSACSRPPRCAPVSLFFSSPPFSPSASFFSPPSQMPLFSDRGNRGTLLRKRTLLSHFFPNSHGHDFNTVTLVLLITAFILRCVT